ncbi:MAG: LamG-like jellyroll fold domain-containing protein [Bacteroidia bacterium]
MDSHRHQHTLGILNGFPGAETLKYAQTVAQLWDMSEIMAATDKAALSLQGLLLIGKLPGLSLTAPASGTDPWQTYLAASQVASGSNGTTNDATSQSALRDRLARLLIWELNATVRGIRNMDDLYEYLLIDVRMSPEVKTSYLVSAMNSLQLYVNRCYNNQEPGVMNEVPERWWEWMSSYRVWQANREVYLYPENYVDPSLRKFASPQFKTLLNAISKGQVTEENMADAFGQYLDAITSVSNLTMVAAYEIGVPQGTLGVSPDGMNSLTYIAGRSPASPYKYYVRKMIVQATQKATHDPSPSYASFGPWEEIGLSIPTDRIALAHAFGRLFVFWVTQTARTYKTINNGDQQCQAIYATITYASQNSNGSWSAPSALATDILIGISAPQTYLETTFGSITPENLIIGLGMNGAHADYVQTPAWNQVVVSAVNQGAQLLVQYGAVGWIGQVTPSNQSFWSAPGSTNTLTQEELAWVEQCRRAYRWAAQNQAVTTPTKIPFLPAYIISEDMVPVASEMVMATNGNAYVLQSTVERQWRTANMALSAGSDIFQRSATSTDTNLTLYWPMLYSGGFINGTQIQELLRDYTGTAEDGTPTMQSGLSNPSGNDTWEAITFASIGNNGYYQLPLGDYSMLEQFTVSMWIRPDATKGQFVAALGGPNSNGWTMNILDEGYMRFAFDCKPPNAFISLSVNPDIIIEGGKWHYIAISMSPNAGGTAFPLLICIDGVVNTFNLNGAQYLGPTSAVDLYVGGTSNTEGDYETGSFNGIIAQVKFWNTALSPDDVMKHYLAEFQPDIEGLPYDGSSTAAVANSITTQLLNISGQPYVAIIDQAANALDKYLGGSYPSGTAAIMFEPTSSTLATPYSFSLLRMGTLVLPRLITALQTLGIEGLMRQANQYLQEQDLSPYDPSSRITVQGGGTMDFNGGFGLYFWELFFYAPYLIAEKLRANQQYAEAERWNKYVFNPTAPKEVQAYWPLEGAVDEGAVSMDLAGGYAGTNYDIALAPAAGMPFAFRTRNVYQFNGTSSYIQVPAADTCYLALNPPQFTLGAWVYVNPPAQGAELPEWQSVVTSRGGGTGYILYVHTAGGKSSFHFWVGNGQGWTHCTDNSTLSYGQWYWVVCTSEDGTMNLYVNGALHAQTTGVVFVQNTDSPLRIGAGTTEGIPNLFLGGMIAEVGLWNTVLTAGEIGAMYSDYPYQRLSNRFWNFAPFRRLNAESLYHILRGDKYGSLVDPNDPNAFTVVQPADHYTAHLQMSVYQYDPFDPDAIARLRVNSYQKAVFMRYIENLTAWGDALFTQNTWESLTDATMHYVLAADLLGRLPVKEVTTAEQPPASYQDMVNMYGEGKVPDFLINMESEVQGYGSTATIPEQVQSVISAYFCIPVNTQLMGLWKTVADRLYKLRHGLNLAGQPNVIPLFAPPIDPAALVAASNSGVSLTVAGNTPPVPAYRFSYLIQQAKALVGSVMQMGNELLAALEKQDAEQLAELQAGYQVTLSQMSLSIKAAQVNQLISSDHALHASLRSATYVRDTYQNYLKHGLNAEEIIALASAGLALLPMAAAEGVRVGAAIAYLFPNVFGLANGGMQFGESVNVGASALEGAAQILNAYGQLAATMGQYLRRSEDWTLQKNIANYQVHEINAQIQANQFALEAAKKDYEITQAQYEQSQHILNFLTTKFTNVELYQWMSGQVGSIYFQMYQLAYAMAQSAQVAYQYETNTSQNFLNPAAWNSLYQGLLAGDTLNLSLSQMESAFVTNARRPLHVRKTYSLRQQNPVALLQLLETGQCRFELSELLYDLDFPGQYNRKIKTLSVSIPAVVGPYQNIHATLTQTHNTVVTKPSVAAVEYLCGQTADMPLDGSIRSNWAPGQQIVISTGVNDSGVFQVNLDDPQYLPFEGTGAVSGWALSIPQAANGFPLRSISDVILSVEYTAQDGGLNYRNALTSSIRGLSSYDGMLYLSLKQLFGGAWFNFLSSHNLPIEIVQQMFAANLNPSSITLGNASGEAYLYPIVAEGIDLGTALQAMSLQDLSGPSGNSTPAQPWTNGYPYNVSIAGTNAPVPLSGKANWNIAATIDPGSALLLPDTAKINPAAWLDLVLVLPYSGTLSW